MSIVRGIMRVHKSSKRFTANIIAVLLTAILIFSFIFQFGFSDNISTVYNYSEIHSENLASQNVRGATFSTIEENIPNKKITNNSTLSNASYEYHKDYTPITNAEDLKRFLQQAEVTKPENYSEESTAEDCVK